MPEYNGTITNGKLHCTRPDLLNAWIQKNDGLWFRMRLEILGEAADPKTQQQLGYYWGLLLPAICERLREKGIMLPVKAFGVNANIPITPDAVHELLIDLCGVVGADGRCLRLSEMDKFQAIQFIDSVISFAVCNLGIDEVKLSAKRMMEQKNETTKQGRAGKNNNSKRHTDEALV